MPAPSERRAVFLVGAVQFINILDFTIVMPLGPDFAAALGVPLSRMGLVTGAYTAAAAVSGLIGSFFLDRFDRRRALALALLGLAVGTAAGGLALGFRGMLAARLVAGTFGGPATAIAYSILADVVPRERRGRAMGAVAGALSVAQVVGIPLGLRLARAADWRLPLLAVAGLGLLATLLVLGWLPPMRDHLRAAPPAGEAPPDADRTLTLRGLLARPIVRRSYAMTAVAMGAGFLVLPNIPAWVQHNLGYPRDRFEILYAAVGVATFATNRLFGRVVDRIGSFRVALGAAALMVLILWLFFIAPPAGVPVVALFVTFAVVLGARNVAYNSLTTQVPRPGERARFLSLQSTVYHLASSAGAIGSSRLLGETAGHALTGMTRVALLAMGLSLLFPLLARSVERRLREIPDL